MPVSVLNAGHGDIDPGIVANGLLEKDVNYAVAVIAKELMEYNGITVPPIIVGSDLNEVFRQVNAIHAKTPVGIAHSIHHNGDGGIGSETIHSVYAGKGQQFAKILEEEFDKIGQVRHGSGFVTRYSSNGRDDYHGFIRIVIPPSVISEYCFLDSDDYKKIISYEGKYKEAEAITRAHCRFHGITYKSKQETKEGKYMTNLILYFGDGDRNLANDFADYLKCPVMRTNWVTDEIANAVSGSIYQIGGTAARAGVILLNGDSSEKNPSDFDRWDAMKAVLKKMGRV